MVRNLARFVLLIIIFSTGFFVIRRVVFLSNQNVPSITELNKISNEVGRTLGVASDGPIRVVNKGVFLLVERNVMDMPLNENSLNGAVNELRSDGWIDGKARNEDELTLCKGQVIVDIDKFSGGPGARGYIGVSWGNASVRCP
jgi:hypothetical protein